MQIPQANSNTSTAATGAPPSTASSENSLPTSAATGAPPSTAGGANPVSTAAGGAPLPIANNTAAPSTTAMTSGDIDPFVDDAMDIDDDTAFNPNFSTVRPPHPIELVQSFANGTHFFVITVGEVVGIVTNIDSIVLSQQTQLAVTQFNSWYAAVGFYTMHFYTGNVRLILGNTPPPDRTLILRRVAPEDFPFVAPSPPPAGSAMNPIFVGTPVGSVAVSAPVASTPTPAIRKDKGKGVLRTPVKYRPPPPKPGMTRVRRKRPMTTRVIVTVSDTETDEDLPASIAPSNGVSAVAPVVAAPIAAPITAPAIVTPAVAAPVTAPVVAALVTAPVIVPVAAPVVAPVAAPIVAPVIASDVELGGAEVHSAIVYGSDEDGPDFLPSYPRAPASGSGEQRADPRTPPNVQPASGASPGLTEFTASAPLTPLSTSRVFVPLFSDGSDAGPRLDLAHVLRSGRRYRLTPNGRSLAQGGADPLSPLTPLSRSTISANASPFAGPSYQSNDDTPVAGPSHQPIAGPSHQPITGPSNGSNASLDDDIEDGANADDEYDVSEIDVADLEAIGKAMDDAWTQWPGSASM